MSKHTPGPWISESAGWEGVSHIVGYDEETGGRTLIAIVFGTSDGQPEHLRNLSLLTSAPELLAALESVLALAVIEYADMSMFDRARAAIAKAKGE